MSKGIYVQVGAGAGDQDARAGYRDGFSEYVKALPTAEVGRIVLIEPNRLNLPALKRCWAERPEAEIYELGVSPRGGASTVRFYYAEQDAPHYQVYSMDPEHVLKHYPGVTLSHQDVPCLTLEDLVARAAGQARIELLSLDVEGIERDLILGTDWSRIDCHRLSFEYIHLGEALAEVVGCLEGHGFRAAGRGMDHNGFDLMYERA